MAASRSTRVTRSTVGLNSLDETFCGRTLRNRSIAHPDDVIPPSLLRSRSPKKKSEQTPTTKGSGTKSAEVKHPGSRESWVSPRKRGLSLSEKDNADKNSVESGDKKQTGLLSPVLKKIKCYLRSEEPSSPTDEESPGTFHTEEPERKSSASDNETDSSRPKRALQCLLLEDTNRREAKALEQGPLTYCTVCITCMIICCSDEEDIPEEFRELEEYKQLLELKKLKKEKMQEIQAESGFIQHLGFKCDNCETEPIQGVRWHCQDCPQQMSVDFCDSCSDCLYETELHKEDHELQPIYKAETFLDRDYCMPHGASYNYLDPNYFPANR
uniref:Zinc finger ZZ-type containing 3 n=1 Tax=Leptobrachium leishanense TaxID=445787 RepID=A0A8C5PZ07_9ANUR